MDTEETRTNSMNFLIGLIWLVLAALTIFFVKNMGDTYLKLKAFDDCGRLSTYQVITEGTHVTYPVADIYSKCLTDKGYTGKLK